MQSPDFPLTLIIFSSVWSHKPPRGQRGLLSHVLYLGISNLSIWHALRDEIISLVCPPTPHMNVWRLVCLCKYDVQIGETKLAFCKCLMMVAFSSSNESKESAFSKVNIESSWNVSSIYDPVLDIAGTLHSSCISKTKSTISDKTSN